MSSSLYSGFSGLKPQPTTLLRRGTELSRSLWLNCCWLWRKSRQEGGGGEINNHCPVYQQCAEFSLNEMAGLQSLAVSMFLLKCRELQGDWRINGGAA